MVLEAAKAVIVILQTRQRIETDARFPTHLSKVLWLKVHFFFYIWGWISLTFLTDIQKFGPIKGRNRREQTWNFTGICGSYIESSVALKWCNYFPKLCKWEISFSHQNSTHYISYFSWNYYISKLIQMVCYFDCNWEWRKKKDPR